MPATMPPSVRALSNESILAVWETGRDQHELDRALTLLAAGAPGATREQLADLSIGQRDASLLQLRTLALGPNAEGFAECSSCRERVQFPISTAQLAQREELTPAGQAIEWEGTRVHFRLPTSRDLAAVVAAPDERQALRRLIERCLIEPDPADELPDAMMAALSRAMLNADPQAETMIAFTCPSCGQEGVMVFEIAHFLWNEIAAQAQRLLGEIDALARAYGWTEGEILSLSPRRRQSYLELVLA
ncbi:MAG: phage baseplate protein [Verrucomicrobiia bacterium]